MRDKEIKAILWDLDGTVIDSTRLIIESYRHAFKKALGKPIDEKNIIGYFGKTLIDAMNEIDPKKASDLIEAYREFNHTHHDEMILTYPGIKDALANIHRHGFKQAIITSKIELLAVRGLELFDLKKYFDEIVGFESTEKHKPEPEPIFFALEKFRLSPEEAIFIGDSLFDAICAKNAGVDFAFALWGPNPEISKKTSAKYCIEDPRDILHIVPRKGGRI